MGMPVAPTGRKLYFPWNGIITQNDTALNGIGDDKRP